MSENGLPGGIDSEENSDASNAMPSGDRNVKDAEDEGEELLALAISSAGAGTWSLDPESGLVQASREFWSLFGLAPKQRLDIKGILALIPPKQRETVENKLRRTIETGAEFHAEYCLHLSGDETRWIRSQARLRQTHQGRRLLGLVWDITEQRQMQESLAELTARLEERVAQRTAVAERRARRLRELAAELSEAEHEERKRLAAMLHDHLQQLLVAARMHLPRARAASREDAEKEIQEVDRLLGDCLRATRELTVDLSPPVLSTGDLRDILEWLGGWFHERHELRVAVSVSGAPPFVPDNLKHFIYRAVRELLFNVVKHAGVGEAGIRLLMSHEFLAIEVEDRGVGFDVGDFGDDSYELGGYGLFQLQERLAALSGRLEIRSSPGDGSCFRLLLPRSLLRRQSPLADAAGEPAVPAAESPSPESGLIRLLVADDHAIVRKAICELLANQPGFQVIGEASTGLEAVQQCAAHKPEVVLMDVSMPEMDGIEATRRISNAQPGIRIIGLSLHDEKDVAKAILAAGAEAFFLKEGDPEELFGIIRNKGD
jgi:PAS domain S-box-containing protein